MRRSFCLYILCTALAVPHGIYDSVGYLFISSFPYGVCRYQIYDERDKSLRFSCIYNQAQIINADFGGLIGK